MSLVSDQFAAAERLFSSGASWAEMERKTGLSIFKLKSRFDPSYKRRVYDRINAWRRAHGGQGGPKAANHVIRTVTPAEAAAALASVPRDTRDLTARLLGDPLPGRSALDRAARA